MALVNGLQQIANILNKDSALMLRIKQIRLAANAATTGELAAATTAATAATTANTVATKVKPSINAQRGTTYTDERRLKAKESHIGKPHKSTVDEGLRDYTRDIFRLYVI